jgi:hypothetical protein
MIAGELNVQRCCRKMNVISGPLPPYSLPTTVS